MRAVATARARILVVFLLCFILTVFLTREARLVQPVSAEDAMSAPAAAIPQKLHHRPQFILHIGPPKTGSTSIQKSLGIDIPEQILRKDNVAYMGLYAREGRMRSSVYKHLMRARCFREYQSNPNVSCWKEAVAELHNYARNGTSVIISSETFSYRWELDVNDTTGRLRRVPFLLGPLTEALNDFDVRVVWVYRRFHEWLVSAINQRNLDMQIANRHDQYVGLWEGITRYQNDLSNFRKWFLYRYMDQVLPVFHGLGDQTMAIRPGTCIVSQLLCHVLTVAPNMCQWSVDRDQRNDTVRENAGARRNFDAALLVQEAVRRKVIQIPQSNRQYQVIHGELHPQMDGMPRACPTRRQLDDLWTTNMRLEHGLVPDLHVDAQSEYAAYINRFSIKLCWLDFDAIFANDTLVQGIRVLTTTT